MLVLKLLVQLVVLRLEFDPDEVITFAKGDGHLEGLVVAVLFPQRGDLRSPNEPRVLVVLRFAVFRNTHLAFDVVLLYHRVLEDVVHSIISSETGKVLRGMGLDEGLDLVDSFLSTPAGQV